jgi:hypothetical protein
MYWVEKPFWLEDGTYWTDQPLQFVRVSLLDPFTLFVRVCACMGDCSIFSLCVFWGKVMEMRVKSELLSLSGRKLNLWVFVLVHKFFFPDREENNEKNVEINFSQYIFREETLGLNTSLVMPQGPQPFPCLSIIK